MKRSAVNSHIRDAKEFIAGMRFPLRPRTEGSMRSSRLCENSSCKHLVVPKY
jgi:hypothetical protein